MKIKLPFKIGAVAQRRFDAIINGQGRIKHRLDLIDKSIKDLRKELQK